MNDRYRIQYNGSEGVGIIKLRWYCDECGAHGEWLNTRYYETAENDYALNHTEHLPTTDKVRNR